MIETTGYNLTPIVYIKELHGEKFTYSLRERLRMNALYGEVIQNQIYLLQEAVGVNLDLHFGFSRNLHSKELSALINEALDPHPETVKFLEKVLLEEDSKEKLETLKQLIEPPENWSGDCEPIWLKGEASLFYLSKSEPQLPIYETFAERVLGRMADAMPGIPKPLAVAAYDRLHAFGAFKQLPIT